MTDLELTKQELKNADDLIDIKNNPVIATGIAFGISLIKSIPCLGDFIDSTTDYLLIQNQDKKQKELIEYILVNKEIITKEKVNDVEFIMNFMRTVDAVNKLANCSKVKYFSNLVRNGYLEYEDKIDADEFDEMLSIVTTLSYREIEFLEFFFERTSDSKAEATGDVWDSICNDWNNNNQASAEFMARRLVHTGFITEIISGVEWDDFGDEDEKDGDKMLMLNQSGRTIGFRLTKEFDEFRKYVLTLN